MHRKWGENPISAAMNLENREELIQLLLDRGAVPSPHHLERAVEMENQTLVANLLPKLNIKNSSYILFSEAIRLGNQRIMKSIANDPNFNPDARKYEGGDTLLHTAVQRGSKQGIEILLEKKAQKDLKSSFRFKQESLSLTPLELALMRKQEENAHPALDEIITLLQNPSS